MAKKTKVWLIIAASLILAGGILFVGVMMGLGWDFSRLTTAEYETNKYIVAQEYENVYIKTITADVEIMPSEDGKTSVICYEQENVKHTVEVIDGTLSIKVEDTRAWYECIGINFRKAVIKVYIPKGAYGELVIKNTTGDVDIPEGFQFENIDVSLTTGDIDCDASARDTIRLKNTTGDIEMENINANNAELRMSTGDIRMLNVVLSGKLTVAGTTGNVRIDDCDAKDIFIKLTTGDVFCKLRSPKTVQADTTTGRVDYPPNLTGEPCVITTTTGNIVVSYGKQ